MIFGPYYCPVCKKTIQLGTVSPHGVLNRHRQTKRHRRLLAEQKEAEIREKGVALLPKSDAAEENNEQ